MSEKVLKVEEVNFTASLKKLIIGDPWYFEHENSSVIKDFCLVKKRIPKMDVRIIVKEKECSYDFEGKECTYNSIEANICAAKYSLPNVVVKPLALAMGI